MRGRLSIPQRKESACLAKPGSAGLWASLQYDLVVSLFYRDWETALQEPQKGIRVVGAEVAADSDGGNGGVFDDDLAGVVAIELGDGIGERGIAEDDVAGTPAEEFFDLSACGFVHQDFGIGGPRDAIRLHIGMVHQHFMLIPPLTVAENIVLGHEPGGTNALYNVSQSRELIQRLSKQYGLPMRREASECRLKEPIEEVGGRLQRTAL